LEFVIVIGYFEVSLKNQEEIKSELKDVKRLLLQVLGSQNSGQSSNQVSMFSFPLNNKDELSELEVWLQTKENYNTLVSKTF
jgi:hypothetical protein